MTVIAKSLSIAFFIGASLIWNMPLAQATTLAQAHQKLLNLQQSQSSIGTQIQAESTQALTLKKTISSYNQSLKTITDDIAAKNRNILTLQTREKVLSKQLVTDKVHLTQEQTNLTQVVRSEYENGSVSYLSVLFQANSFSDLLSRIHDLSLVAQEQKHIFTSVQTLTIAVVADVKQVKSNEAQVTSTKSKLQYLETTQQSILNQRERNLKAIEVDIKTGKEKQGLLESQIKLSQSQIQAIEAATRAAEQRAANPVYVEHQQQQLVAVNVSNLLAYAQRFLSTPYVWGGTVPSGFDCSGFTQYVFRNFGVDINRTSEEQFASGVPVNKANLQPGDLVFFSTYAAGATHVGIYIGNDLMVDAQDMGVSIDNINNSYWASKYIGARRYIK